MISGKAKEKNMARVDLPDSRKRSDVFSGGGRLGTPVTRRTCVLRSHLRTMEAQPLARAARAMAFRPA
jgi:hypothetical protein